jgi:ankyrin repeat protein
MGTVMDIFGGRVLLEKSEGKWSITEPGGLNEGLMEAHSPTNCDRVHMIEKSMVNRTPAQLALGRQLLDAIDAKNEALAGRLLNDGADPNVFDAGNTALMHAVSFNNRTIISLLIQKGADINARAMNGSSEQPATPLQVAVTHGSLETVRLLLDLGADPNLTNWSGQSPQQFAAQRGDPEIIRILNGSR